MQERERRSENIKTKEWFEKSRKSGITDKSSTNYDGTAGYDLLEEIHHSTEADVAVLMELAISKDCTEICRRHALHSLTNLYFENKFTSYRNYKYRDNENVIKVINLLRNISDDKEDEEDVRVCAYENYRALRHQKFGPISKKELTLERDLSEKETSPRMKLLRYIRD
jgi:hypothetical protein